MGVTEDLGGPGVDVWNNNHGNMSEALVDPGLGSGNPDCSQLRSEEDSVPTTCVVRTVSTSSMVLLVMMNFAEETRQTVC